MGKVGYSSFSGVARLSINLRKRRETSQFAFEVLALHAALEREMDEFLSKALRNASKLKAGKLGFGHKIAVMHACWAGEPQAGDNLTKALLAFNELRNAVAHGDNEKTVKNLFLVLIRCCQELDSTISSEADLHGLAIGICTFMGDDKSGQELHRFVTQHGYSVVQVFESGNE